MAETVMTLPQALRHLADDGIDRTHYDGCWQYHWRCCMMVAADVIDEYENAEEATTVTESGGIPTDDEREDCPHDSGVERVGDLLSWCCRECGEITPWSAKVRMGGDSSDY